MNAIKVKTEIVQYEHTEISEMLNRFVQYVEVSPLSVRSYISGIKAFIRYLSENGISKPTRETVIAYKKELVRYKSASTVALYLSS